MTTHHADCWRDPAHHACAVAEIERLRARLYEAKDLLLGAYGDRREDNRYRVAVYFAERDAAPAPPARTAVSGTADALDQMHGIVKTAVGMLRDTDLAAEAQALLDTAYRVRSAARFG